MKKLKSLKKSLKKPLKKSLKKPLKKSLKKPFKTLKKVINGGATSKFVASGSFGCVYKDPPIQCDTTCPKDQKKKCQTGISKLMSEKNALEEKKLIDNLFENFIIDKSTGKDISHYFITNPHKCNPLQKSLVDIECTLPITNPSLLIYENGGLDLFELFNKILLKYGENKPVLFSYLLFILTNLINILEAIRLLLSNHILHKDIKTENIVIGLDKYNFRLIDFGLSIKYENLVKCFQSPNNLNSVFICSNLLDEYSIGSYFNLPVYTFFLNDEIKKLGIHGNITEEEKIILFDNIYVYFPTQEFRFILFSSFLCDNDVPINNDLYEIWLIMKFILEKHKIEGFLTNTKDQKLVNNYLNELYLNFLNNNLNPVERFLKIIKRMDYYAFGLILVELFFKYLKKIFDVNFLRLEDIFWLYKNNKNVKNFLDYIYNSRLLEFNLNIDLPDFDEILKDYKIMIHKLTIIK